MQEHDARLSKKEKIFKAALQAYSRYGIQGTTAKQIAELAGIGKSTIFEYFKNLDELTQEAFGWYIADSQAAWAGLRKLAGRDAAAALSGYFNGLMELILHEPGKLLLISQYATAILVSDTEFAKVKQNYQARLQPSADSLTEALRFIASAGIQSGVFKPTGGADDRACALLLTAVAREMQAQAFVQDEEAILETCRELKRMAFLLLGCTKNLGEV